MGLIGKRVFIIGNNFEEPVKCGVLKRLDDFRMPVVEVDNKEFISLGMLIPYSDRLYHMIREVPKKELWEIFQGIKIFWYDLDKAMKGKE